MYHRERGRLYTKGTKGLFGADASEIDGFDCVGEVDSAAAARGGSGAVRGPLTRSVELAQSTSDFGVEAGTSAFQRTEILAEGTEPERPDDTR